MERVFCVCLISFIAGRSTGQLSVYYNDDDHVNQFGLFDTPYANLPADGIGGYLYYSEIQCDSTFQQSPFYHSLLLVDDYHLCILQRIALAKQAGYDCLLTYTVDDSVSKISDAVFNTGFPVAIIKSDLAQKMKNGTSYSDYTIYGDITYGISIIYYSFLGIFCILWCVYSFRNCFSIFRRETNENYPRFQIQAQIHRDELTESILRQLQGIEVEGGQRPLGQEQIRALPETAYRQRAPGDEGKETCSICVHEIVNGVSIKTLPCNHIFHSECIDEWLGEHSSFCPLCKIDVGARLRTCEQRSHSINAYCSDDRLLLPNPHNNYGSSANR